MTDAGFWTEARVAWLIENLKTRNVGPTALARAAGVTRNCIVGKIHRLQLAGLVTPLGRPPTPRRGGNPRQPKFKPRAPTMTRETVVEPVPMTLDEGKPITLLSLTTSMCSWPHGDPACAEFRYCGHAKFDGSPYCEAHTVMGRQGKKAGATL